MDCQLSDWTGWSKCSKSCEGGIQHRLRDEVQLDFSWQKLEVSHWKQVTSVTCQPCCESPAKDPPAQVRATQGSIQCLRLIWQRLAKKCASKLGFRWLEHRFHVFLASPFSSLIWRTSSCSCFLVVFLPQSLHWLHGLRSLESLNLLTRVTATLKVSVWCNNWFRNIRNLFYLHSPKLGHWKILKPGDVWFKT